MSAALDLDADVTAVLHPEERAGIGHVHDREPVRCWSCGTWIEPAGPASVSVALDGDTAAAELAHRHCAPSRADLAPLVAAALADPQGLAYAQPRHPDAGAVLVWQRTLDVRLRGAPGGEVRPYVDAHRRTGFEPMRREEPVGLLADWRLVAAGGDLLLTRAGAPVDRFAGAAEAATAAWREALEASGHCLLIVGTGLEVRTGGVDGLQEALRSGAALLGLVALAPG